MKSKFELFSKNKMNSVYLTESMQTDWLQILYSYWGEVDTPYSGDFYFCNEWLFQYYNDLPLGEAIESY